MRGGVKRVEERGGGGADGLRALRSRYLCWWSPTAAPAVNVRMHILRWADAEEQLAHFGICVVTHTGWMGLLRTPLLSTRASRAHRFHPAACTHCTIQWAEQQRVKHNASTQKARTI